MSSEIRDINLAESGEQKIEWVRRNCDLLRMLEEEFSQSKPFAGKKVTLSVHLEAKTAYLCKVLAAGGAEMYVTGSNPLSTQDDVAAAVGTRRQTIADLEGGRNVGSHIVFAVLAALGKMVAITDARPDLETIRAMVGEANA